RAATSSVVRISSLCVRGSTRLRACSVIARDHPCPECVRVPLQAPPFRGCSRWRSISRTVDSTRKPPLLHDLSSDLLIHRNQARSLAFTVHHFGTVSGLDAPGVDVLLHDLLHPCSPHPHAVGVVLEERHLVS